MKRFDNEFDLVNYMYNYRSKTYGNNKYFNLHMDYTMHYLNNALYDYLGCTGSEIVENKECRPTYGGFEMEVLDDKFKIYVTSVEIEEDCFENYYWVENETIML